MLNHAALWVEDLEPVIAFYERYLKGQRGPLYANPEKGFQSCFISFGESSPRLEVMRLERYRSTAAEKPAPGYAHIAFSVGSEQAVDRLVEQMRSDGVAILDGPRWTGDGYYECVAADPAGNLVEITV